MSVTEKQRLAGVMLNHTKSLHEWSAVGEIADRENTSKSRVLRKAIRMYVEANHADLLPALDKPPDQIVTENAELRAEIERLRSEAKR